MKIGIDALTVIPGRTGGLETYITNLVRGLGHADPRNEYVVFALPQAVDSLDFGQPNVRIEMCPVPATYGLTHIRVAYQQLVLPFQIKRLGVDAMIFPSNVGCLRCSCKSVVIIHDLIKHYYAEHFPGEMGLLRDTVFPRLIEASARAATRIVAISEFTKQEIVQRLGIPADKITLIYNGIDESSVKRLPCELKSSVFTGTSAPYVLFVGSHHLHKNLVRLVRAFVQVKNRTESKHVLVIAGGEETGTSALKRELRALQRRDILLLSTVSADDLAALYGGASLLAFPSLIEGFGLPLLEAMACGVPIVASHAGPIPEVVGDAAVLFDPRDVDSMADAIEQVLFDEELACRLVTRGNARVQHSRHFSWRQTVAGLLSVVDEVT